MFNEECWNSVPLTDFPRDNKRVEYSDDILFLAKIIKNFKDSVKSLNRYVQNDKQKYLFERKDGVLLFPTILKEIKLEDQILIQKIKAKALRKRLRETFYSFRRKFLDYGGQLIVDNVLLMDEELFLDNRKEFVKCLRWPICSDDLILNRLFERKFLDFEITNERSFKFICPLDGRVQPLKIEIITPDWVWGIMCGRHWEVKVCPHCLGHFETKLVALN